jgi:hypothetical protein
MGRKVQALMATKRAKYAVKKKRGGWFSATSLKSTSSERQSH